MATLEPLVDISADEDPVPVSKLAAAPDPPSPPASEGSPDTPSKALEGARSGTMDASPTPTAPDSSAKTVAPPPSLQEESPTVDPEPQELPQGGGSQEPMPKQGGSKELASLWESRTDPPLTKLTRRATLPSAVTDGVPGRRWEVKVTKPLASWLMPEINAFKKRREGGAAAEPVEAPLEFEHKPGEKFFPLDELKAMMGDDSGIDVANKELYLEDEHFQAAFGKNREEYSKLPKWRQVLLKKKVGLF